MVEWKLHFLSGSNIGDEVILMNGETIIGTDEITADFVLSHNEMFSEAFGIYLDNDKAYLTNLDVIESLSINDEEISSRDNIEVNSKDNIYIDGFKFSILKVGDIYIETNTVNEEIEEFEVENNNIIYKEKPKLPKNKIVFIVFIVFSIGIFFVVISSDKVSSKYETTPIFKSVRKVTVEEITDKYKNLNVVFNDVVNKYDITGYVGTISEKETLIKEITSLKLNVSIDIYDMESIIENVKFILDNFGLIKSRVVVGEKIGYVTISGLESDEINDNVASILQNEIPGLIGWELAVNKKDSYLTEIKKSLIKNDLYDKLKMVINDDKIELYGDLTLKEKAIFDKINKEFALKFEDVPMLVLKSSTRSTRITKIQKKKDVVKIDFNVKAVSFNNIPFVILANDKRYTKGMQIPSGHIISDINDTGVILTKDKIKTFIKFKAFDG